MKRYVLITSLVLIVALALSCATTGPGGKKDLILISSEQEVQLGQEFDKQVRSESKILDNQAWQDYFNRVGQSIVAVSDRKDLEYHFTVIESPDINAFAVPGGYVYIYTGLLDIIENEAQFAAVTAHEISHVVARHSIKRMQQVLGVALLYQIVMGEASSEAIDAAIGLGLNIALSGYSRDYEREADKYGVYYMEVAGYNPEGAVGLFDQLEKAQGGAGEGSSFFENLFASHPETQERIKNVAEQLAQFPPAVLSRDKHRDRYLDMKELLPATSTK
jgi:predicted Zn-dependent protease